MPKQRFDYRTALLAAFGAFVFLLTLKNAEIAANGIKKGLWLVTNTLIPSLFPFLVLSDLLLTSGVQELAVKFLARPARFCFGLTKNGTVALLLGWLCGVPVGAVSALTMLKNRRISVAEFERLLLFSGTPSTGFLIGAVGTSLFGNKEAGIVLFLITLLVSFATGVFLKLIGGNIEDTCAGTEAPIEKQPLSLRFTGAVRHGSATLLEVTAFVLFFSAVAECVTEVASTLALPDLVATLFVGLLELTAGVSAAVLSLAPTPAFCLCAFFAGFSGLSICLQIFSITADAPSRLFPYLLTKLASGFLSAALAYLYLKLRAPVLKTATAGFAEQGGAHLRLPPVITLSFAFLLILFLFTLVGTAKLKLVTFTSSEK